MFNTSSLISSKNQFDISVEKIKLGRSEVWLGTDFVDVIVQELIN